MIPITPNSGPQSAPPSSTRLGTVGLISTSLSSGLVGSAIPLAKGAQTSDPLNGLAAGKGAAGSEGQSVAFAALLENTTPPKAGRVDAGRADFATQAASGLDVPETPQSASIAALTDAELSKPLSVAPRGSTLGSKASHSPVEPGKPLPPRGLVLPLSQPVVSSSEQSPATLSAASGVTQPIPYPAAPITDQNRAGTESFGEAQTVGLEASALQASPRQGSALLSAQAPYDQAAGEASAAPLDLIANQTKAAARPYPEAAPVLPRLGGSAGPIDANPPVLERTPLNSSARLRADPAADFATPLRPVALRESSNALPLAPSNPEALPLDVSERLAISPALGSALSADPSGPTENAKLDVPPAQLSALNTPSFQTRRRAEAVGSQAEVGPQPRAPLSDQPAAIAEPTSKVSAAQGLARQPKLDGAAFAASGLKGMPPLDLSAPLASSDLDPAAREVDGQLSAKPLHAARSSDGDKPGAGRSVNALGADPIVAPLAVEPNRKAQPDRGASYASLSDEAPVNPVPAKSDGKQSNIVGAAQPQSRPQSQAAIAVTPDASATVSTGGADTPASSDLGEATLSPDTQARVPVAVAALAAPQSNVLKTPRAQRGSELEGPLLADSGRFSFVGEAPTQGDETPARGAGSSVSPSVIAEAATASAQTSPSPGTPNTAPTAPVPAAIPTPSIGNVATSSSPSQTPAPVPTAIEQFVEQIAEAREASRSARPELSLRHGEFGTVGLRIDTSAGVSVNDWRASLTARDPGFVPAVQAALAERAIAASSESASAQNGSSSQRGQDQNGANSGSQSQSSGANLAGSGSGSGLGTGSGQDQRYGSSTGDEQASVKPYSGEEADSGSNTAAADTRADPSTGPDTTPGGALFA